MFVDEPYVIWNNGRTPSGQIWNQSELECQIKCNNGKFTIYSFMYNGNVLGKVENMNLIMLYHKLI